MKRYIVVILLSFSAFAGLDGKWMGNCVKQDTSYLKSNTTVTGHDASFQMEIFLDSKCANSAIMMEAVTTIQEGALSPFVENAVELDSTISKILITPTTDRIARQLNSMGFCGAKDWKVGEAKDVTGLTCQDSQMPKTGDREYTIYSITENTLAFGKPTKEYDGTSPEKRPRELDTEHTFTRQ